MNLMIDLEALDKKETGVVLSVGLCTFDINGIHDKKYFILDGEEQIKRGRTVDFDTLDWWFRQDKAVTDEVFNVIGRTKVEKFLKDMSYFCSKNGIREVYAQGIDYDLPKIVNLYDTYGIELPYEWWAARDSRTLRKFANANEPVREGTYHNAMDDAVYQAECVIVALKEKG